MIKKAIKIFPALMLGLLSASCDRIEVKGDTGENIDFTVKMDEIPLQMGQLVSATSGDQYSNTLWFEQSDKTIVGVRINMSNGTISKEVIRIERK